MPQPLGKIGRAMLDQVMGVEPLPGWYNHDPKIVEFMWHGPTNGESGKRPGGRGRCTDHRESGRAIPLAARAAGHFNLNVSPRCRPAAGAAAVDSPTQLFIVAGHCSGWQPGALIPYQQDRPAFTGFPGAALRSRYCGAAEKNLMSAHQLGRWHNCVKNGHFGRFTDAR